MTRALLAVHPDPVADLGDMERVSATADVLSSGGDARLALDIESRLNKYGCSVLPRILDGRFSSSTASSISPRALCRADMALEAWRAAAARRGEWAALDQQVEGLREEFCDRLGLCVTDVDIVFAPSGTDAQLQALAMVRALIGTPLVTIVAASDETGSGTVFTASGRHFLDRTAHGHAVAQGAVLDGMGGIEAAVMVPANDAAGPRPLADIDEAVIEAVSAARRAGRKVMVQAMNASKFGRRCPSDACLDLIRRRWSGTTQIVVDACQMRLSAQRLRDHLALGDMVLVTGSKFFTGPAFSGALLVPSWCRARPSPEDFLAKGLGAYASRQDWPSHHRAMRAALPARLSLGPWLRWEAAMAEMTAYGEVPIGFRREVLGRFAAAATALTRSGCRHALAPADELREDPRDEEFALPTIFPFMVETGRGLITPARAASLHADLNRDMAWGMPLDAGRAAHDLAGRLCHLGQPVPLTRPSPTAALRVSADARFVVDCWSPDRVRALGRVEAHLTALRRTFDKLELLQDCMPSPALRGAQEDIVRS